MKNLYWPEEIKTFLKIILKDRNISAELHQGSNDDIIKSPLTLSPRGLSRAGEAPVRHICATCFQLEDSQQEPQTCCDLFSSSHCPRPLRAPNHCAPLACEG